jgi:hypothetical protein
MVAVANPPAKDASVGLVAPAVAVQVATLAAVAASAEPANC